MFIFTANCRSLIAVCCGCDVYFRSRVVKSAILLQSILEKLDDALTDVI